MARKERKITIRTRAWTILPKCLFPGPRIVPDKVKQVFEPFFTSKAQGMGIGLSIARTIIEAHSGRIWADNQTTGGAVFHISLPLA
jgi:signal transduction histidine kinase